MKQTATEWLFEQLWEAPKDKFTWNSILMKAKAMGEEQIKDAYGDGLNAHRTDFCNRDEYYNQTYKEDKQ